MVSYAEKGEITQFGKPLYKIAGIDTLILRAYLGGPGPPQWVVVYSDPLLVDPTGEVARLLRERYEPAAVVAGRSVLRLRT